MVGHIACGIVAVLIPALGACVGGMTGGERRLAERLQDKLDADYLLWYDVPVGPQQLHPDFIVLHPRRGLLILEVKDWRLDTIRRASRGPWTIVAHGQEKAVRSPFEQARHHAEAVVDLLRRDPQLVWADGRRKGDVCFPWSYGVVFTDLTRAQFDSAGFGCAIEPHRVLCKDEMRESAEPEDLQSRLWDMFPTLMRGTLTLPQIDRVRWALFPEVRVDVPAADAGWDEAPVPDILRVMDLQQEQLARSLGDGHRVIHGVAGSGKTMILCVRAEHLAQTATPERPVLVLCYNRPLALQLQARMASRGVDDRVLVRPFHQWCRQQLVAHGQPIPPQGPDFFDALPQAVAHGVDRGMIASGQYRAVLIDEGHDFSDPAWLQLAVRMVDPTTQALLLLYDDAQRIYGRRGGKRHSLKSAGIQAQGRTTVLKVNYRNTREILRTASALAADLLRPAGGSAGPDGATGDDEAPLLQPVSCGRPGPPPLVIRLPDLRAEATRIAEVLANAHATGHGWGEMAVICRRHEVMRVCAGALRRRGLPHEVYAKGSGFRPGADAIHILTMHASKGLEFQVVALPGVGQMPGAGEDEVEEARLFYVAATRAMHTLCVTLSGTGGFMQRFPA